MGGKGSPKSGRNSGYEARASHDESHPDEGFLRGIRAYVMDQKGDENHDEIKSKGHPELRKGNEKNVSIVSLNHRKVKPHFGDARSFPSSSTHGGG